MTKIISIKDEAYDRLKKMKGDKSFTEIIMDLTEQHKTNILDFEGLWADDSQIGLVYDEILAERREKKDRTITKW